jgi:hypothetical protein
LIARTNAATAGEKRRPSTVTSDASQHRLLAIEKLRAVVSAVSACSQTCAGWGRPDAETGQMGQMALAPEQHPAGLLLDFWIAPGERRPVTLHCTAARVKLRIRKP